MQSIDGHSSLVFNGEIYNYLELKREYLSHIQFEGSSDTEVLLYLLKSKGTEAISLMSNTRLIPRKPMVRRNSLERS